MRALLIEHLPHSSFCTGRAYIASIVAAIFGFSGVAGAAANIAWILAVIGIVLAIAFFVMGRRPPLP